MRMHRLIGLTLVLAAAGASAARADDATSFKPLPAEAWTREAALHLLRRAAFQATPDEVDALFELGPDAAVASLVDYGSREYRVAAPAIPEELYRPPDRRALVDMSPEARREEVEQRRRMERRAFEETRLWWIERLAASPRPLEEKMTLFWHGHFTSGMREVRDAVYMKEQNDFLRRNALGHFGELLAGISRDRAMLVYLDGRSNSRKQPNENYARELLELFTLGVGNYTESDIKAAARAFTGWTFDRYGFTFRVRDHDDGKKKFLGREGNLNGDDVLETILAQPECSKYLAQRLLQRFVTPEPDRKLVEAFARVIRQHKYEMRPIMRTLLRSEAFYHPSNRGSLIKSPVELLVGAARSFGLPLNELVKVERALVGMGQELMQPPNVRGWPGDRAWINTATLFNRYNAVAALIAGEPAPRERARDRREPPNDEQVDDAPMQMMTPVGRSAGSRSRLAGGPQPAFDPLPWLRDRRLDDAGEIVDFFAAHLLAVRLPDAKREQLIAFLLDGRAQFDARGAKAAERVRAMVTLLCSTPEYQLN